MIITAGKYKGRKVIAPDENITRPTLSKAREGIFSALFSIMDFEGKNFLDLFAGSGIMGLEALSRGFENVTAFEKHPKVAKILKENYKSLGLDVSPSPLTPPPLSGREINLKLGDSLKLMSKTDEKFDVIYIDPPYLSGIYENCLEKIKERSLLKEDGIVILEHVAEIDWKKFGFELIKQKQYSKKFVTFLSHGQK
jgi:16S rRNA (guanine(966)-N(2))-methyltransferase RsmD